MKKQFVLLFAAMFVMAFSVNAQNQLTLPDIEAAPGETIFVPVTADLDGICSFEMDIDFNPAVIEFQGVTGEYHPGGVWVVDDASVPVQISWIDPTETGLVLTNETLFYLEFNYVGGDSPIAFLDVEIGDCLGMAVPVTTTDGSVTELPPVPLTHWGVFVGLGLILVFVGLRLFRVF